MPASSDPPHQRLRHRVRRLSAGLLSLPAGRRAGRLVIGAWVLAVMVAVAGGLSARFGEAQQNDPAAYLPAEAESLRAEHAVQQFPAGRMAPAVVVYHRQAGLNGEDRARISRDRQALNSVLPRGMRPFREPTVARDGRAALLFTTVPARPGGEQDVLHAVRTIRREVGSRRDDRGLTVEVTRAAGLSADATEIFGGIDGTLVLATAVLVFLLLVIVYRSPVFWALPLFAVAAAEVTARTIGYFLSEAGVVITGQSAAILPVLVFGAGTDYALLLVARYREELRRHEDHRVALRTALRSSGPTIIASGLTIVAALLCLSLAELSGTAGLGPIGAMGIGVAVVATLTLLPALLAIGGRRVFWPFVPLYGAPAPVPRFGWRRLGKVVVNRPRRTWLAATAVLLAMCGGLVDFNQDLTNGNFFRSDVESVHGQKLLDRSFPGGTAAPALVVVPQVERAEQTRRELAGVPGVVSVGPIERGPPGARFTVALDRDPYSHAAHDLVPALRAAAKRAGGPTAMVGGTTAEARDVRLSAARDNRVIVPVVLLVVLLILVGLLRAIVAPLMLIATVVLSFGAALGVGAFFFERVFDFAGMDPALPLLTFIFLVALGIDYNIFLMARVREEVERHGTREGTLRGLTATGGVITSAGIVLAGTFTTLALLPAVLLTEIGFVVAFGVLLDTLLVRSLLVPALVVSIGRRSWWPSQLARRRPAASPVTPPEGEPVAAGLSWPALTEPPQPVAAAEGSAG